MLPHHIFWKAELFAKRTDFVFVEFCERLDKETFFHEFQNFWHAVVVRFDFVGVLGAFAFDRVRINRALAKHPLRRIQFEFFDCLGLDFQKHVANYFAFFLGGHDAFQSGEKFFLRRKDVKILYAYFSECGADGFLLIFSKEASINKKSVDARGAERFREKCICNC